MICNSWKPFFAFLFLFISSCSHTFEDQTLVFLNIRDFDRLQLAEVIKVIDGKNPDLILLDVWFPIEKDSVSDYSLREALARCQSDVVFGVHFDKVENMNGRIEASHPVSTIDLIKGKGAREGHAMLEYDLWKGKPVIRRFHPFVYHNGDTIYHLGVVAAGLLNPSKTKLFLNDEENLRRLELNAGRINGYDRIDHDFSTLTSGSLKISLDRKIVVFGYIGPSNEDKKYTDLNDNHFQSPDTYGPIIVGEIISQILYD